MADKTPNMQVFITFDGDGIGKLVGRAELEDQPDKIRKISQQIDAGNEIFRSWCERTQGEVINIGGDEGRIAIDPKHLSELPGLCETYESASGATVSIGVGMKLSDSAKALLVAKLRGKNRIVMYTPDLEPEIKAAVEAHEKQSVGSKEVEEYLKFEKAEEQAQPAPQAGDHEEPIQAVAPKDEKSFEDHFHDHAQAQATGTRHESAIKHGIMTALQTVKQFMPQIEELKQQRPEVYQTIQLISQELIAVAHDIFGKPEASQPKAEGFDPKFQPPPKEEPAEEPAPKAVAKSEQPSPESQGYTFKVSHGPDYTTVGAFHPDEYARSGDDRVGSVNFSHMPDGSLVSDDTWVHERHQRKGIARHMYSLAAKETGKEIQPSTLRTQQGAAFWTGKSEGLAKGSLQRKLPYNPQAAKAAMGGDLKHADSWVAGGTKNADRGYFPRMEGHERQRALNKLTAATKTRRNHAGEVEFLLHRGMGRQEYKSSVGQTHVDQPQETSWTPRYMTAKNFGEQYAEMQHPPMVASAWIPEKHIHAIPKQLGSVDPKDPVGMARHTLEHEVIVAPHTSELAQKGRDFPATRLADIHGRINEAGKRDQMLRELPNPKHPDVGGARVGFLKDRMQHVQKAELNLTPPVHPPQLHNTVEGFMGGLKAIPKGTPARGKFITQHMNHGPFLTALKAHPQGAQVHAMLTQHLNSAANAGFKPGQGVVAVAKSEEIDTSKAKDCPKELIGELLGNKVYLVDGSFIRDNVDIEYTEGGNHGRYSWVPENEIWLENSHNSMDVSACALHELLESKLMSRGMSYDDAHTRASAMEKKFRTSCSEADEVSLAQAGAWFQEHAEPEDKEMKKAEPLMVPMKHIRPDPKNLAEAHDNIRRGRGSVTEGPVVLYRRKGKKGYELGNGHHRFVEAQNRGETHIHATVSPDVLDKSEPVKKTATVQSGEAESVGSQTFGLAEKAPESKPMKKKFGLPGSRTRNLKFLPGAIKDGKIKVIEPDTGKPSWKGVRSGMVRSNDDHPISSREPEGK